MAIYYISPTGNNSTGDGSAGNPWQTVTHANGQASDGDELRIEKQTVTVAGSPNLTWTNKSRNVLTSSSLVGTIAVGTLICKPTGGGNGNQEAYYHVTGINASQITLAQQYYGTTETVSGYKNGIPTTAMGSDSNTSHMIVTKHLIVSGGWNLSTETRDGESFVYHSNTGPSATVMTFSGGAEGATLEYMNFGMGGSNQAVLASGTGMIVRNVSVPVSRRGAFVISGANTIVEDCWAGGTTTATNPWGFSVQANNITFENCMVVNSEGVTTSGGAIRVAAGIEYKGGIVARNCLLGCLAFSNSTVSNLDIVDCHRGVFVDGNNVYIKDGVIKNLTEIGIAHSSSQYSTTIENVEIDSCTTGITSSRTTGVEIIKCSLKNCSSNGINVNLDSGDFHIYNTEFVNPGNFGVNIAAGSGLVTIKGCSIDAASEYKAFRVVVSDFYNVPAYIIMDSFNTPDGAYYARGQVTRDDSFLDEEGEPTLKLQYMTEVFNNRNFMPVGAVAVSQGVGGTVSYKLTTSGTWVGKITPILRLNKIIIKEGTDITSVTNGSWDSHSITVSDFEVLQDGELTLEFRMNANTTAINIGGIKYE